VLEFLQEPRFPDAAMRSMANARLRHEQAGLAGSQAHDIFRLYYLLFVLYLDMTGGVTRTRLQNFCSEIGLTSPGRAAAFLNQLQRSGYVVLAETQADRRSRLYRPTQAMRDDFRRSQIPELAALALVEPEVEQMIAHYDDPAVFRAYLEKLATGVASFVKGSVEIDLTLFSDRNAGMAALFEIIATASPGDSFPPQGPLQASLIGLSKKLRVSRGHLFKLFNDAEKRGLLTRDAERSLIWLGESLRVQLAMYLAAIFVGLAASCYEGLARSEIHKVA
jgi:hypothetical protein